MHVCPVAPRVHPVSDLHSNPALGVPLLRRQPQFASCRPPRRPRPTPGVVLHPIRIHVGEAADDPSTAFDGIDKTRRSGPRTRGIARRTSRNPLAGWPRRPKLLQCGAARRSCTWSSSLEPPRHAQQAPRRDLVGPAAGTLVAGQRRMAALGDKAICQRCPTRNQFTTAAGGRGGGPGTRPGRSGSCYPTLIILPAHPSPPTVALLLRFESPRLLTAAAGASAAPPPQP